ncbi:hypothetical protein DHC50_20850 [Arenibacter sp. A80]|nr:hypothetical protein [Arenibacter sp. A80]RFT54311.1 hypothetical protein D0S24_20840 [Arenibacter sp. P308M17]
MGKAFFFVFVLEFYFGRSAVSLCRFPKFGLFFNDRALCFSHTWGGFLSFTGKMLEFGAYPGRPAPCRYFL